MKILPSTGWFAVSIAAPSACNAGIIMLKSNLYVVGTWFNCDVILLKEDTKEAKKLMTEMKRCGKEPVQTELPSDYPKCTQNKGVKAIDYTLQNIENSLVNVLSAPSMYMQGNALEADENLKLSFAAIFTFLGEASRSGLWEKVMIDVIDGKKVDLESTEQADRFTKLKFALQKWAKASDAWKLDKNVLSVVPASEKREKAANATREIFPETFPDISPGTQYPAASMSWAQLAWACEYKVIMNKNVGNPKQVDDFRAKHARQRKEGFNDDSLWNKYFPLSAAFLKKRGTLA
jgi:hypothetical protein